MYLEIISIYVEERVLDINMMETLPSSLCNEKYKTTFVGKLLIMPGRIMKHSFICRIQQEHNSFSALAPHSLQFMASRAIQLLLGEVVQVS